MSLAGTVSWVPSQPATRTDAVESTAAKGRRRPKPDGLPRGRSRAPAGTANAAVARVATIGPSPDAGSVGLALRLNDLIRSVRVRRVDQADVALARQGVHLDQGRFGHRTVGSSVAGFVARCGIRPMHVAQHAPLVKARVTLGHRLAPHLEREAGAVTTLASRCRIGGRVVRRVVEVVVVPAAPGYLSNCTSVDQATA